MAISSNQIDETLAKQGTALQQLAIQVEAFESIYAQLPAGARTGLKTFVSTQVTAIQSALTDVVNAVNALP